MGFWDALGKVAGAAINEVKGATEKSQVYRAEVAGKSDSELASIIKRDSSLRKGAVVMELKSRGYDNEAIATLVRNVS